MPVAVNCCAVPRGMLALAGASVIESKAGPETVSVVEFEIEPEVAEMVVVPWPELVASP